MKPVTPSDARGRVVVTVMGEDHVGIVARIAKALADHNVSIADISQKLVGSLFLMIVVGDLSRSSSSLEDIKEAVAQEARSLGVSAAVQHEKLFKAMHRI
jgi:ACT domain-containing protein